MSASLLPLPTDQELPEDVLRRLRARPPISIYRLIATAPQLLIPWTDLVSALYQSTVAARLREIAILRQAACANCQYELHQHGILALSNGTFERRSSSHHKLRASNNSLPHRRSRLPDERAVEAQCYVG